MYIENGGIVDRLDDTHRQTVELSQPRAADVNPRVLLLANREELDEIALWRAHPNESFAPEDRGVSGDCYGHHVSDFSVAEHGQEASQSGLVTGNQFEEGNCKRSSGSKMVVILTRKPILTTTSSSGSALIKWSFVIGNSLAPESAVELGHSFVQGNTFAQGST
jgi:hypothetical protein